jgi:hypothetical protein
MPDLAVSVDAFQEIAIWLEATASVLSPLGTEGG